MLKKLIPLILLFACSSFVFANETPKKICTEEPKFISLDYNTKQENIVLNNMSQVDRDAMKSVMNTTTRFFQADVNNDGNLAGVFTYQGESDIGGNVIFKIFEKKGNQYQPVGKFSKPETKNPTMITSGSLFYYDPYHPKVDQVVATLCGRTYLTLAFGDYHDTYYMKDGKTYNACDDNWASYQRRDIKHFYDKKLYNFAYSSLKFYTDKCKGELSPALSLWLQNDMALAAFKSGNVAECHTILNEMIASADFKNAPNNLKKAVAFNQTLCPLAKSVVTTNRPTSTYSYAWLLDPKLGDRLNDDRSEDDDHNRGPLPADLVAHMKELAANISPDLPLNFFIPNEGDGYFAKSKVQDLASRMLQDAFDISIDDNRYAWFLVMDADNSSILIWVDTVEGKSVMALGHPLYIISKDYNSETVPPQFKKIINDNPEALTDVLLFGKHIPIVFFDTQKNELQFLSGEWLQK